MLPTYVHARDHLQRATAILKGADSRTRQLRYIIERTIKLMEEIGKDAPDASDNVLDFVAFRERQAGYE